MPSDRECDRTFALLRQLCADLPPLEPTDSLETAMDRLTRVLVDFREETRVRFQRTIRKMDILEAKLRQLDLHDAELEKVLVQFHAISERICNPAA
jgi:hypothetical protein